MFVFGRLLTWWDWALSRRLILEVHQLFLSFKHLSNVIAALIFCFQGVSNLFHLSWYICSVLKHRVKFWQFFLRYNCIKFSGRSSLYIIDSHVSLRILSQFTFDKLSGTSSFNLSNHYHPFRLRWNNILGIQRRVVLVHVFFSAQYFISKEWALLVDVDLAIPEGALPLFNDVVHIDVVADGVQFLLGIRGCLGSRNVLDIEFVDLHCSWWGWRLHNLLKWCTCYLVIELETTWTVWALRTISSTIAVVELHAVHENCIFLSIALMIHSRWIIKYNLSLLN